MNALIAPWNLVPWQHSTETERLFMHTLRAPDLPVVYAFLRDLAIAPHLDFPHEISFQTFASNLEAGAFGQFYGLWERDGGDFVGVAALDRRGRLSGWCRLLYALQPEARGRGLAHEAALRILETAFRWTEAKGVTAAIHRGHAASQAVAQRLGMKPLNLSIPELEIYGLARSEWEST